VTWMRRAVAGFVLVAAIAISARAADTPVDTMRQLYMAAEYESALAALEKIDLAALSVSERVQVEGYHAACLVALGRSADAERVMETTVKLDPRTVQPVDTSPKLRALFATVRGRVIRQVVRDRYARAKSLYDGKQFAEAQAAFDDVVSLLALPTPASGSDRWTTCGRSRRSSRSSPRPLSTAPNPRPRRRRNRRRCRLRRRPPRPYRPLHPVRASTASPTPR
jgi:hypothetical protein